MVGLVWQGFHICLGENSCLGRAIEEKGHLKNHFFNYITFSCLSGTLTKIIERDTAYNSPCHSFDQ